MNQFKKMFKLLALITVFGLVVGCGKKHRQLLQHIMNLEGIL